MADVTVQESGTYPATNYVSSFFSDLPTDLRFTKTFYQQIGPHTAIDSNSRNLLFVLDRLDAPYCYLPNEMLLQATVLITKEDGITLPDTDKIVGPCNNSLGSLFQSVQMKINDDVISASSSELYPYHCYIQNLLTFGSEVKFTQLNPSGWMDDFPNDETGSIEPENGNLGFLERSKWFRKNFNETLGYRPEGATFVSKFKHALSGCFKPLPYSRFYK